MKEITLKEWSAYLPYGLKVKITNNLLSGETYELSGIPYDELCHLGKYGMFGFIQRDFSEIKPVLRDLSDLTKARVLEGEMYLGLEEPSYSIFKGYNTERIIWNTMKKDVNHISIQLHKISTDLLKKWFRMYDPTITYSDFMQDIKLSIIRELYMRQEINKLENLNPDNVLFEL